MRFHAGYVSDRNQAEEVHATHALDGFHAGNVIDRNQAEEAHSDSHSGWDFTQTLSALKINSIICSLPPVGNI